MNVAYNDTYLSPRFAVLEDRDHDYLDFTPLFADTVLSILPSSLVLVASLVRIGYLWDKHIRLHASVLRFSKLLSLVLYACSQLALIVCWTRKVQSPSWNAVLATTLSLTSAITFCILSHLEHARSIRPSSILLIYLSFSSAFDILRLRASWSVNPASTITRLTIASVVFKVLCLVLEAIEKARFLPVDYQQYRPEETSSILNRSIFFWLNKLMTAGARSVLVPSTLYKLDPELSSDHLAPSFIACWQALKLKKHKHSVLNALVRTLKWQILRAVFPRLILLALTVCQPILIESLLQYLQQAQTAESEDRGRSLVAAYSLTFFGMAIFTGFYWHSQYRLMTMIRSCLVSALDWQVIRLDVQSVKDPRTALTLMSGDVDRIIEGFKNLHEFWANTIQIVLITYLLSRQLGFASVIPIAVAAIATAAVSFTSKAVGPRQKQWMEAVEERVSLTSSILSSIKEVKMKGLSTVLTEKTHTLRIQELQLAARSRILVLITGVFAWSPDLLSPAATFLVFYAQARHSGTTFDSARAFTSLSLILLLAQNLKRSFMSLPPFVAAFACLQRIEQFVCAAEQQDFRDRTSLSSAVESGSSFEYFPQIHDRVSDRAGNTSANFTAMSFDVAIKVTDGCFGWSTARDVLKDVNTAFPSAKLSCIIGPVASGKSTFCKALLGETRASRGRIELMPNVRGIAYCSQTPFLVNRSIRHNIIGFSTFEQGWYDTIIRAVALRDDISLLPDQDRTVVGTDGANLSGGQRHKVALARALYSRKQIIILDDVLSGLDVTSAEHIAQQVLGPNGLASKYRITVIFATHAANILPLAHHIVVLNQSGEVEADGPLSEVRRLSPFVQSLKFGREPEASPSSSASSDKSSSSQGGRATNVNAAKAQTPVRQTGDLAVYLFYFRAAGISAALFLLFIGLLFSAAKNFPTIWLKIWSDAATLENGPGKLVYPVVYACIQCLALLLLGALFYQGLMVVVTQAGKSLHSSLLEAVMNAPLFVYSKADIGSLTNRFSQDMSLIDVQLAFGMLYLSGSAFMAAGQAIVIAVSSPWATTTFPFIVAILFYVQKFYLRTSRQLRLIDIEAKSPLYTHFLESTTGLVTLRAFGWTDETVDVGRTLLDESQRPAYLLYMIQRWLIFVLDIIVACLATVVAAVAVAQGTNTGFAGSALSQLVTFSQALSFIIIDWTDIETSIGAVSRIKDFGTKTPVEHKRGENEEPPADWPSRGLLQFQQLSATYGETSDDLSSLKQINLTIAPGEKLGICGRSGSGKSSMILTLLRMLEIKEGSILADGLDLGKISRNIVRSRFNTLPQHPIFLRGSVRMNLDPEQLWSDGDLITALQKVGLAHKLINQEESLGLDSPLLPETLSHGQRQLFALAGAILRKSQVVILDEVTSNVDSATDVVMQRIIREEFAGCTVVAVAHRLNTIMDFDRVIVMSDGQCIEMGAPSDLLKRSQSHFKTMWETAFSHSSADLDHTE